MHTNECKDYLKTESITVFENKLLFSLKNRQVNVKINIRNMYSENDMQCSFESFEFEAGNCPPVDTRRTRSRAIVPHYPAQLFIQWIVIALYMTLDDNIYKDVKVVN